MHKIGFINAMERLGPPWGKMAERLGLKELSMGMSDDFETAVRFGATQVRVGSALFGARGLIADALQGLWHR